MEHHRRGIVWTRALPRRALGWITRDITPGFARRWGLAGWRAHHETKGRIADLEQCAV
jgi:hypothetical protein